MTEVNDNTAQRDRSPAYPIVPLEVALARLVEFEAHFKRTAARREKVGEAWGIKAKAYADRTLAALGYFGLLEYKKGAEIGRDIVISEEGWKYLRAQQEQTKQAVVKAAALRPKQIAKFWANWGADRPAEAACIDELTTKNGFSVGGAREFLKVYDATISFAKLSDSDKMDPDLREEEFDVGADEALPSQPPFPSAYGKVSIMDGERVVFTEESNPQQYVKLLVSGDVDETLLDALQDYVKRQKKRLRIEPEKAIADNKEAPTKAP
jgi:hypothetical protein